jgi:hypothetical protein
MLLDRLPRRIPAGACVTHEGLRHDPRLAVRGANELVGEVLDELEELFRRQRTDLEQGLDSEQTPTEDLRQAIAPYSIACSRSRRGELTRNRPGCWRHSSRSGRSEAN